MVKGWEGGLANTHRGRCWSSVAVLTHCRICLFWLCHSGVFLCWLGISLRVLPAHKVTLVVYLAQNTSATHHMKQSLDSALLGRNGFAPAGELRYPVKDGLRRLSATVNRQLFAGLLVISRPPKLHGWIRMDEKAGTELRLPPQGNTRWTGTRSTGFAEQR